MADSSGRTNKWTFIIYPSDSLPENWKDIINSWHVPVAVSPQHDADINGDGTEKKVHRHVIIDFGSGAKKSLEQVINDHSSVLRGCLPQPVISERGLLRYFVHLDNPEKAQYNYNDIICFSGFDISDAFKPSASLANEIMTDMKRFVIDNGITEFADLQRYALDLPDSWGYVLNMYNCFSIYKLIDSQRNSLRVPNEA